MIQTMVYGKLPPVMTQSGNLGEYIIKKHKFWDTYDFGSVALVFFEGNQTEAEPLPQNSENLQIIWNLLLQLNRTSIGKSETNHSLVLSRQYVNATVENYLSSLYLSNDPSYESLLHLKQEIEALQKEQSLLPSGVSRKYRQKNYKRKQRQEQITKWLVAKLQESEKGVPVAEKKSKNEFQTLFQKNLVKQDENRRREALIQRAEGLVQGKKAEPWERAEELISKTALHVKPVSDEVRLQTTSKIVFKTGLAEIRYAKGNRELRTLFEKNLARQSENPRPEGRIKRFQGLSQTQKSELLELLGEPASDIPLNVKSASEVRLQTTSKIVFKTGLTDLRYPRGNSEFYTLFEKNLARQSENRRRGERIKRIQSLSQTQKTELWQLLQQIQQGQQQVQQPGQQEQQQGHQPGSQQGHQPGQHAQQQGQPGSGKQIESNEIPFLGEGVSKTVLDVGSIQKTNNVESIQKTDTKHAFHTGFDTVFDIETVLNVIEKIISPSEWMQNAEPEKNGIPMEVLSKRGLQTTTKIVHRAGLTDIRYPRGKSGFHTSFERKPAKLVQQGSASISTTELRSKTTANIEFVSKAIWGTEFKLKSMLKVTKMPTVTLESMAETIFKTISRRKLESQRQRPTTLKPVSTVSKVGLADIRYQGRKNEFHTLFQKNLIKKDEILQRKELIKRVQRLNKSEKTELWQSVQQEPVAFILKHGITEENFAAWMAHASVEEYKEFKSVMAKSQSTTAKGQSIADTGYHRVQKEIDEFGKAQLIQLLSKATPTEKADLVQIFLKQGILKKKGRGFAKEKPDTLLRSLVIKSNQTTYETMKRILVTTTSFVNKEYAEFEKKNLLFEKNTISSFLNKDESKEYRKRFFIEHKNSLLEHTTRREEEQIRLDLKRLEDVQQGRQISIRTHLQMGQLSGRRITQARKNGQPLKQSALENRLYVVYDMQERFQKDRQIKYDVEKNRNAAIEATVNRITTNAKQQVIRTVEEMGLMQEMGMTQEMVIKREIDAKQQMGINQPIDANQQMSIMQQIDAKQKISVEQETAQNTMAPANMELLNQGKLEFAKPEKLRSDAELAKQRELVKTLSTQVAEQGKKILAIAENKEDAGAGGAVSQRAGTQSFNVKAAEQKIKGKAAEAFAKKIKKDVMDSLEKELRMERQRRGL